MKMGADIDINQFEEFRRCELCEYDLCMKCYKSPLIVNSIQTAPGDGFKHENDEFVGFKKAENT